MRDFGSWFSEQRIEQPAEIDEKVWLKCYGCGKEDHVSIKALETVTPVGTSRVKSIPMRLITGSAVDRNFVRLRSYWHDPRSES